MRKSITMILAVASTVGSTGFAGAKAVDTGPPVKKHTTVSVENTNFVSVPHYDFPAGEAPATADADYCPANIPKIESTAARWATPKVAEAFIDRHRRSGASFIYIYTSSFSNRYNSLKFFDRHRRS